MGKYEPTVLFSPSSNSDAEGPNNFYLWGYQPHFLNNASIAANKLFRQLDDEIQPDVLLVAINCEPESSHPNAVVEPEDHEFGATDFEPVLELAEQLKNVSPSPTYAYSADSPLAGKAWLESNQRRDLFANIREAIRKIVIGSCVHNKRRVYISGAREIGPFIVFSVLLIPEHSHESHPRLHQSVRGQYSVVQSLIDASAASFVSECYNAILSSIDGSAAAHFPDSDSILRSAGESFMYTPCGACDEFEGLHGGFATCNEIATLTYEKAVGVGRIILAQTGHDNIVETISFKTPPSLDNYRAVRKLLELTTRDEMLVSDSNVVTGLGKISGSYDASKEDLFVVEFTGHAKWQLVHGGIVLMKVEHGVPKLPQIEKQIARFNATFQRLFPQTKDRQRQAIKGIVRAASSLKHGTIIVISDIAESESDRFGIQATKIEPIPLTEELIKRASRIDGAILISPDGICHAIGVILDGKVNDKGSSERGSRYNSTIRYVHGSDCACIGVVVSDDGMVDVIPEYRPIISRQMLEGSIEELEATFEAEEFDDSMFEKRMGWIHNHRFYLSQSQCESINRLNNQYQALPMDSGFRTVYPDLEPDTEMNDSYFAE